MPRVPDIDRRVHIEIGGRLRQLRTKAGWTQERLAEALTTQPATVSRYETGAIALSVTMLHRIAAVFEVPAGVLLGGPSVTTLVGDPETEVVGLWRGLSQADQAVILELLRRLDRS